MNHVLTQSSDVESKKWRALLASDHFVALSVAVLFHLFVMAMLLAGWQENAPVPPKVNSIKVQIMMQAPTPEVQAAVAPPPVAQAIEPPPTVVAPQVIKEAMLAKKRVDEPLVEAISRPSDPIDQAMTTPSSENAKPSAKTPANSASTPSESSSPASASSASANQNFDSSQYFPVQKEAPSYPQRALDKNVQGVCTVRYTVNTEGRVESPEALGDCHAFFIKPSLEATKSFRYTPRVVDGIAVKVPNVKNTFQYRIE